MKENLIRSLRGEEGEVLTEYKDHLGYSTIGVGRLIDKRKGGGITKEESAYLLNNDIDKIIEQLDKRISWWKTLDEARRGVLVNMAFQMGVDGLLGFKNTLAMIQSGRYSDAAKFLSCLSGSEHHWQFDWLLLYFLSCLSGSELDY